jgi:hypothetical protein
VKRDPRARFQKCELDQVVEVVCLCCGPEWPSCNRVCGVIAKPALSWKRVL